MILHWGRRIPEDPTLRMYSLSVGSSLILHWGCRIPEDPTKDVESKLIQHWGGMGAARLCSCAVMYPYHRALKKTEKIQTDHGPFGRCRPFKLPLNAPRPPKRLDKRLTDLPERPGKSKWTMVRLESLSSPRSPQPAQAPPIL